MTTITQPARVIVLGVGNLLLRDEGIGVHVANAMQGVAVPGDVSLEVIDGGTLPDAVLSLDTADKLIVIDAIQTGGEAGAIYRFHPEDIDLDKVTITSMHQISLLENLWLMKRFGNGPEDTVIIGVEPEDISWGLELSEKLKQRIPQIVRIVMEEINSTNSGEPEKGEL